MKVIVPFSVWFFVVGSVVLLFSQSLGDLAALNFAAQMILFVLVVCIPAWRTGRMSYVDIAWPWGLVVIGLFTLSIMEQGYWLRTTVVAGVYLLVGLRMGVGALVMWQQGHLQEELPRYQYQRIRWQEAGVTNTPIEMQKEALAQGFANSAFLCLPGFIMALNPSPEISVFEILGLAIWFGAYVIESVADAQKLAFAHAMKKAGEKNRVCNVGLWKYSRHPNYFAEWMVWNALVIAALPSWMVLYGQEAFWMWCFLGMGLLAASYFLFCTLVSYTGAVPSEYYSELKRPEYKDYKKRTNMFFPGPRKTL